MKSALLEQHTATDKKIEKIELDTIQTKGLQTRAGTDPAKVAEYAEIYRAGGPMPPIVVFSDGGDEFYLADGHHRLAAARKAELDEIEGLIKKGDRRAALWYATAANAQHGLPRTNEDKRRAVGLILADAEWRQLSDAQLAEHAQVSDRLIAKVRKELGAEVKATKGKDGKMRKKPVKKAKVATMAQQQIDIEESQRQMIDEIAGRITAAWKTIPCLKHCGHTDQRARTLAALTAWPATADYPMNPNHLATDSGLTSAQQITVCGELVGIVTRTPKDKEYYLDNHTYEQLRPYAKESLEPPKTQAQRLVTVAGPEDLTVDSIAQSPKASPEIPPGKSLQQQGEDLFQKSDPAPKAEKPAPPQTKGDLILIAERDLISVELLKGKPQWTGTDNDLLALALIVGVPTRKLAWIDSIRANAQHLFIEALRSEVADRVRNGEHTNRGWPVTPELCRLWGLDYQALHLRAQHQVEK
jgi:hypothetical protein